VIKVVVISQNDHIERSIIERRWLENYLPVYMLHSCAGAIRREPKRIPPGPKRAPDLAVVPWKDVSWSSLLNQTLVEFETLQLMNNRSSPYRLFSCRAKPLCKVKVMSPPRGQIAPKHEFWASYFSMQFPTPIFHKIGPMPLHTIIAPPKSTRSKPDEPTSTTK
jgi:hypothetical protein